MRLLTIAVVGIVGCATGRQPAQEPGQSLSSRWLCRQCLAPRETAPCTTPCAPALAATFDPAPGTFATPPTVTLSSPTPGAVIHYTTDGTPPTERSPVYGGPIPLDGTATIQAVALAEDLPGSRVSSGTFEFAPPQPPPIAIRPEELDEKVLFETGTAKLDPRSAPLLDAVAVALLAHGEIDRVLIEGHTDAKGNEAFNEKLSQDRAEAVREYLIDKGVPPDRLDAQGFGSNRPIADNGTPEGREANRRVEFVVAPAAAGTEQMGTGSGR